MSYELPDDLADVSAPRRGRPRKLVEPIEPAFAVNDREGRVTQISQESRLQEIDKEIDRDALRHKAEANIRAKLKKAQEKKLLEQFEKEAEVEFRADPNEAWVSIIIELPRTTPHIKIDGKEFWDGTRYTVRQSVADFLLTNMENVWRHEAEINGQDRNSFVRPMGSLPRHRNGAIAGF